MLLDVLCDNASSPAQTKASRLFLEKQKEDKQARLKAEPAARPASGGASRKISFDIAMPLRVHSDVSNLFHMVQQSSNAAAAWQQAEQHLQRYVEAEATAGAIQKEGKAVEAAVERLRACADDLQLPVRPDAIAPAEVWAYVRRVQAKIFRHSASDSRRDKRQRKNSDKGKQRKRKRSPNKHASNGKQ